MSCVGPESSCQLSPSNHDNLKSCCVVDGQDGAAHPNLFLQLLLASFTCLGRVADTEFVKVLCYEALDAWWYVEEVEREVDELFGNQNAFARCSQTTWRSDLRLLAVWICSQIMAECSTVLGKPGMSNLLGKWCRSNYLQEARWSFALPALRRQSSPQHSSGQCL